MHKEHPVLCFAALEASKNVLVKLAGREIEQTSQYSQLCRWQTYTLSFRIVAKAIIVAKYSSKAHRLSAASPEVSRALRASRATVHEFALNS